MMTLQYGQCYFEDNLSPHNIPVVSAECEPYDRFYTGCDSINQ